MFLSPYTAEMEMRRGHRRLGYAVAVAATAATVVLKLLFVPLIGSAIPHQTFIPAVLLAAFYGGFWPGVLATLLGAFIANYAFTPPYYHLEIKSVNAAIALPLFVFTGLMMSALCESLHRTRY